MGEIPSAIEARKIDNCSDDYIEGGNEESIELKSKPTKGQLSHIFAVNPTTWH